MNLGLKGKVALVSGANNPWGIGAATALAFAQEGAKLVLVYKKILRPFDESAVNREGLDRYHKANGEGAAEVGERLTTAGADHLILEGDITEEESVKAVYDAADKRFGGVDILVNNAAAYFDDDDIFSVTSRAIDGTFAVNVKGTLLMTQEFVKRHVVNKRKYGRIVNLSSDSAKTSFAGQITYGASKSAIESLTKSIATEIGPLNITINAVAPGPTQTGWIDEDLKGQVLPDIPLGRLGTPEDISDTIVFLASERASWITGQTIRVCGGHIL